MIEHSHTDKHQMQHSRKIHAIVENLLIWYGENARDLPWRRTNDPYCVYVSEIMLQQTQVKTVIAFWERWMRELPTIAAAAKAPSDQLHKLWEGLGYYTRVRNLQRAAQMIVEKHGGRFPDQFAEVLALPGIGRYTAGAICSIAFNQPTPLLDGNVIRVFTRLFGIAENPKEKVTNARLWQLAEEMVVEAARLAKPERACSHLNQSLMELGALICTPRNPQCLICPVKKLCVAFREGRVDELPNLGKRPAATARRFVALAVERDGRFAVRQREAGVVNAHLWEFPNVEVLAEPSAGEHPSGWAAKQLGLNIAGARPLCVIKHSITRYRITLEVFAGQWKKGAKKDETKDRKDNWLTLEQMRSLAFTSAHGKILRALAAL
jgi:A/G-specific adenine glycosylase